MGLAHGKLFRDWSKVQMRRGINPRPIKPTQFIPQQLEYFKDNYWRDRPTRQAIEERFCDFTKPTRYNVEAHYYELAKSRVFKKLNAYFSESLKPHSFSELWKDINLTATSGFPLFKKKGEIRQEAFVEYSKQQRHLLKTADVDVWPCAMMSRLVVRERSKNKPRLVWIYPMHMITLEARYVLPLMEVLKDKPEFGWSYKWLDEGKGWWKMYRNTRSGYSVFNMDFSCYDGTVPGFLINDVFRWIETLFEDHLTKVNAFKLMRRYFVHTPISMYDGIEVKHRGIPSGSYFTSLVGSLCNLVVQEYFLLKVHWPTTARKEVCVLGDDSLSVWLTEGIDPTRYTKLYSQIVADFGLEAHPDKASSFIDMGQEVREMTFLGMPFVDRYPYFRFSYDDVMARVVWPENEDRTPEDTLTRLHGLVWAYGIEPRIYQSLSRIRRYLLTKYEVEEFNIFDYGDREVQRYFRFVMNTNVNVSSWPTYSTLIDYYYGN